MTQSKRSKFQITLFGSVWKFDGFNVVIQEAILINVTVELHSNTTNHASVVNSTFGWLNISDGYIAKISNCHVTPEWKSEGNVFEYGIQIWIAESSLSVTNSSFGSLFYEGFIWATSSEINIYNVKFFDNYFAFFIIADGGEVKLRNIIILDSFYGYFLKLSKA